MFSQERDRLRQVFFKAWQKHKDQAPVEPLEAQVIDIILQHPEYQQYVDDAETYLDRDFAEANPFLHMSLHLAVREQVGTNRPAGITVVYQTLCQRYGDAHQAEHRMVDCLAETLWQAQRHNTQPDEQLYLQKLQHFTEI